jgi:hypothetical protein
MDDSAFWLATERCEEAFCGSCDVAAFRREMADLGHPADVIEERIEAIHPDLARKAPK